MNRIIKIITRDCGLYSIQKFIEAAGALDIAHELVNPLELSFSLNFKHINFFEDWDKKETYILPRITGTTLDDIDLLYCKIEEEHGATIINHPDLILKMRDKAIQTFHLSHLQISVFKTWALRGPITDTRLFKIKSSLIYKNQWVLKTFRGNKGVGISLIQGEQSLKSIWETLRALGDERFILQPRYKIDREWRILVIPPKGHIVGGFLKELKTASEFRHNSPHINAHFADVLPPSIQGICDNIVRKIPLDIMGIDIAECGGTAFVCEINPVPGFKLFDQISGKNIAQEILEGLFF